MRAVAQRVTSARVDVDDDTVGAIGAGLLIYLGVGDDDTEEDARWMATKLANLRIFVSEDDDRMTRSLLDVGGEALVVSQFTLYGDVRKGRRPSFDSAAHPDTARALLEVACDALRALGLTVATGRFQATMQVHGIVDGPVTILVDSEKKF